MPKEFVKPLYDEGQKDYHDLKISTTAKTPKRIPIAKKGDTDPKPAKDVVEVKQTKGLSQLEKNSKGPESGLPDCAKRGEPEKCSTFDWPLPHKLEWPLFPEAHTDYHDFKPAPCFDKNGKFMDRCNPYAINSEL